MNVTAKKKANKNRNVSISLQSRDLLIKKNKYEPTQYCN